MAMVMAVAASHSRGINKKLAALPDRASALPLPLPHQGRDAYVLMFYVSLLSIRTELIVM